MRNESVKLSKRRMVFLIAYITMLGWMIIASIMTYVYNLLSWSTTEILFPIVTLVITVSIIGLGVAYNHYKRKGKSKKSILKVSQNNNMNFARGGLAMVAMTTLVWITGNWIIDKLMEKFSWNLVEPWISIITLWFGIFVIGSTLATISSLFMHRVFRQWNNILLSLKRMAEGDFNIQIDYEDNDERTKQLASQINETAKQLNKMEQMKQDFISNVSHEIQSPLTSIQGFAFLLKSKDISIEERNHYLNVIELETTRLSKISDNLMKLTNLDREREPLKITNFFLNQQLRQVCIMLEPMWRDKNLHVEFVSNMPVELDGDEDLWQQVWINLLTNAIKFTAPEGKIQIDLLLQNEKVIVRVSDTGIGMTAEESAKVFQRFYKADKSRTGPGSGLGLSIVEKIVSLHSSEISLESEKGKGSVFIVTIPAKQPQ